VDTQRRAVLVRLFLPQFLAGETPALLWQPHSDGGCKFSPFRRAFATPKWLRPRKAGFLSAPITGGVSHKTEELSNGRGVPGVPGEEIL